MAGWPADAKQKLFGLWSQFARAFASTHGTETIIMTATCRLHLFCFCLRAPLARASSLYISGLQRLPAGRKDHLATQRKLLASSAALEFALADLTSPQTNFRSKHFG